MSEIIEVWTDGSAVPNPGVGGFAVMNKNGKPLILGREEKSTNIRMEMLAIISAMKRARGRKMVIHTDSQFTINVLTKWARGWESRGWKKAQGEIKNLDLVKEAWEVYGRENIEMVWTKGHAEDAINEAADEWARRARLGEKL
ncbi:MAG: ribonuclease HI [Candidatus Nomurabacteria bacterium]|jgi:ribonuclease HI|nr:ribonuclease HI [Candidatus Nomurabacteria bacterium]